MSAADANAPTEFRVWAPRAERMTLQVDGARHPTVANGLIVVLNDVMWSPHYQDTCGSNGLAALSLGAGA